MNQVMGSSLGFLILIVTCQALRDSEDLHVISWYLSCPGASGSNHDPLANRIARFETYLKSGKQ